MFTLDQIETAHSKVKSGADFPAYSQELIWLGLIKYDIFVIDGHAEYFGENGFRLTSGANYQDLIIADKMDIATFRLRLKIHQKGGTDYLTFCRDAADAGVIKWTVDLLKMTCTYYNKEIKEVLSETIPGF